jgi:hypothetical protein
VLWGGCMRWVMAGGVGAGVGCGFEVWGSCEVCGGCVRWEGREIIEILCGVG